MTTDASAAGPPAHHDHGAAVAAEHGVARSNHWPAVEHAFLSTHPVCAHCGAHKDTASIQAHHCFAQHEVVLSGRPDLELDPRNFYCLCEHEDARPANDDHLVLGHLDSYRSWNPHLADHIEMFKGMTKAEIMADPRWIAARDARPGPWDEWTPEAQIAFRAMLDEVLPPDPEVLAKYGFTLALFVPSGG